MRWEAPMRNCPCSAACTGSPRSNRGATRLPRMKRLGLKFANLWHTAARLRTNDAVCRRHNTHSWRHIDEFIFCFISSEIVIWKEGEPAEATWRWRHRGIGWGAQLGLFPSARRERVWGRRFIAPLILDTRRSWVVSSTLRPLYPREESWRPLNTSLCGPQRRSGRFGRSVGSGARQSNRTEGLRVLPGYLLANYPSANVIPVPFPVLSCTVTAALSLSLSDFATC
jgi:hypothetical protein